MNNLHYIKSDREKDEAFEKFKNNLEKDKGNMKNSGFICKKIQKLLNECILNEEDDSSIDNIKNKNKVKLKEQNKKEILNLCNTDIEINGNDYSFAPYYYRAIYYKLFEEKDEKSIEKAQNDLKKAKEIIISYKESLMELHSAITYASKKQEYEFLIKYIEYKVLFLHNISERLLDPTIKNIKEVSKPMLKKTTLLKYFNQSIFNDYINEIEKEGFNFIYVIYERISLVSFGFHLFSGIMKMAFGAVALITFNINPLLNGLNEIIRSIEDLWGHYEDNQFNVKDFFKEYAIFKSFTDSCNKFKESITSKKKINRKFECNLDVILNNFSPKEAEKIAIETTKWATKKVKEQLKNCSFKGPITTEISKEKVAKNLEIIQEKVKKNLLERLDAYDEANAFNKFIDLVKQDEINKKNAEYYKKNMTLILKKKSVIIQQ